MKTRKTYIAPHIEIVRVLVEHAIVADSENASSSASIVVTPDTNDGNLVPGGSGDAGEEGLAKPGSIWYDE